MLEGDRVEVRLTPRNHGPAAVADATVRLRWSAELADEQALPARCAREDERSVVCGTGPLAVDAAGGAVAGSGTAAGADVGADAGGRHGVERGGDGQGPDERPDDGAGAGDRGRVRLLSRRAGAAVWRCGGQSGFSAS
ncbi:hypothetical protein LT493_36500 [Streptomyces tricolor]|nr:hypothetical protein [Streptomyces tricolor]